MNSLCSYSLTCTVLKLLILSVVFISNPTFGAISFEPNQEGMLVSNVFKIDFIDIANSAWVQVATGIVEAARTTLICYSLGNHWGLDCTSKQEYVDAMLNDTDQDNTVLLAALFCHCANSTGQVVEYRYIRQRPTNSNHFYLFTAIEDGYKQPRVVRITDHGTPVHKIYLSEFLDATNDENMKLYSEKIPVNFVL